MRTFVGHALPVLSVAFSGDGKYALSGSGDKTLYTYPQKLDHRLRWI
jgi:WD40 repeat protein